MADVETILLSAPGTSSQQPADLLQILTNNNNNNTTSSSSSSSSSTSHPSSSSSATILAMPSSSSVANISTTTAVDTTQQQQNLCSSKLAEPEAMMDEEEPEIKRRKTSPAGQTHEKLESRLNGILCCAVCLDLPKNAIYQCQMGHLMCAACFTHLLADGRLRDQAATCPNCRVEISKSSATRNLAVEKAVSELPSECQYCNKEFPSKSLERHEIQECEERPTNCKYTCIGCPWNGPVHEAEEHQEICSHPRKSGAEVMAAIQAQHNDFVAEKKFYSQMVDLLSYEKIIFSDLQMKPYRTDEYVQKLFYETARFSAFNHQFAVKARINNSQRDPHQSNDRHLSYQLILKTKTTTPLSIHYFVLKGPFSDTKMDTKIYKHDFTDAENASEYQTFPLPDSSECNKLLAAKAINFRLIMFLLSK